MQSYFSTSLYNLLSSFWKGCSKQHALSRVIETWKQCLDSRGIVGTILMELSKAFDCIPHDVLIAKLKAYGHGRNSLSLILSYYKVSLRDLCLDPCFSTYL